MNMKDRLSNLPARVGAMNVPARLSRAGQGLTQRLKTMSLAARIWAGAIAVLVVALAVLMWPQPLHVEAAAIDRGMVRSDVVDEGKTRIHDVYVVAAPVGGALQRIDLEAGDAVTRDQIVATILPADPALLDARVAAETQAGVAAARSALAAAEADSQLAERDRQRVERLFERDFASQAAMDAARASARAASAQVSARRADLARARAAASAPNAAARVPTSVRSPVEGRVLRLLQESESVVGAGAPLMEIGDPAELEVVAEFLSQDAVRMHAGARAWIENWGGDEPIPATVWRVEPFARTKISALGVEEQRVNVILHLSDPENAPALGHGFRVDARVVLSEEERALRAPTDALVRDGEGWAVFRLEDGRARLTPVMLGEGDEDYRAVRDGLSEGDRVVLFPGNTLADGARVRAQSPAP